MEQIVNKSNEVERIKTLADASQKYAKEIEIAKNKIQSLNQMRKENEKKNKSKTKTK